VCVSVCVLLQLHIFMFEDFVHILDSVVSRRREKPWSRSSLDNTTHTCSSSSSVFTSSYTLSLLYCFHRCINIQCNTLSLFWLWTHVLYTWFDQIIRNKCEQFWVVVLKDDNVVFNFCLPVFSVVKHKCITVWNVF